MEAVLGKLWNKDFYLIGYLILTKFECRLNFISIIYIYFLWVDIDKELAGRGAGGGDGEGPLPAEGGGHALRVHVAR